MCSRVIATNRFNFIWDRSFRVVKEMKIQTLFRVGKVQGRKQAEESRYRYALLVRGRQPNESGGTVRKR